MSMGNWNKSARNDIWLNYINEILWNYYESIHDDWDLTQEAPCSWCGKRMVKGTYFDGSKNEGRYSWDVDHIDNNHKNNYLDNLQPMHPRCNKMKGREQNAK